MNFPILFKKTKTGALQFWEISTSDSTIITVFGQLGTDSPQRTEDVIREGKNLGKVNETTAETQAEAEAKARWEKQVKKGYVKNKESAAEGKNELGGVAPMLAHSYDKHGHKVVYPAMLQPKLDGVRCLAVIENGAVSLWSRTRKPITGVPHIQEALEAISSKFKRKVILDGELYDHAGREDFEGLISVVRQQKKVSEDAKKVAYHIYDAVVAAPFTQRMGLVAGVTALDQTGFLKFVPTKQVEDEQEMIIEFETFRAQGYEGAMVRSKEAEYEHSRSYSLLKVKEFLDEDFKIVGMSEGRGKLAGHAATFTCVTETGAEFEAKLMGSLENLKYLFETPSAWKGKKLTVKFQKWSGANKVPIFPVGKAIRDYE